MHFPVIMSLSVSLSLFSGALYLHLCFIWFLFVMYLMKKDIIMSNSVSHMVSPSLMAEAVKSVQTTLR